MTRPATAAGALPLDLARRGYSYVERPNPGVESLLQKHVFSSRARPRILDVGCGCGATARALQSRKASFHLVGIEPNPRAAELARQVCSEVFQGTFDQWRTSIASSQTDTTPFDAVVLADVLEHIVDPAAFLQSLLHLPEAKNAVWVISVPNYAVWYNRAATLVGHQRYRWSGLWDRTHLRFFTRSTARELFEYCGLSVVDETCTPSLVQSLAPVIRRFVERDVDQGDHLAFAESPAYDLYRSWVEPLEHRVCSTWPALLGFQVVFAARPR